MTENNKKLLERLSTKHSLTFDEYLSLIKGFDGETAKFAAALARSEKEKYYSDTVFIRGLIEISSICKNDCLYCGLRASNKSCERYRLTEDEILSCCEAGFALGFRTFVLQGG